MFEKIKPGQLVKFNDGGIHEVESKELDVLYLVDQLGNSFTATENDILLEGEDHEGSNK